MVWCVGCSGLDNTVVARTILRPGVCICRGISLQRCVLCVELRLRSHTVNPVKGQLLCACR